MAEVSKINKELKERIEKAKEAKKKVLDKNQIVRK